MPSYGSGTASCIGTWGHWGKEIAALENRRAAALAPDLAQPRLSMGWSYFLWKGQLDTLKAVLNSLPLDGDPGEGGSSYAEQRLVLFWERKPDSLLAMLKTMRPAEAANNKLSTRRLFHQTATRMGWTAEAPRLKGDSAAARMAFDSGGNFLGELQRKDPNDWFLHAARGWRWRRWGDRRRRWWSGWSGLMWIIRTGMRRGRSIVGPGYWRG